MHIAFFTEPKRGKTKKTGQHMAKKSNFSQSKAINVSREGMHCNTT